MAIAAESLASYTLQITKNENAFLPKYHKDITSDIIECTKNVYIYIMDANDVKVRIGYNPGSKMIQTAGIGILNALDHFIKEELLWKEEHKCRCL